MRAPWGAGMFEVAMDGQDANMTQALLSGVISVASRVSCSHLIRQVGRSLSYHR